MLVNDLEATLSRAPDRVVLIVGAGVTMGALHKTPAQPLASWSGLLHHGLARCESTGTLTPADIHRFRDLLSSDNPDFYLLTAEVISKALGAPEGGEFRRWLRESVGSFASASQRTEVLQSIRALSDRGVLLATVNYDGVLEQATGLPPVTWRHPARVERVLNGDERGILHLHGYWDEPESVILGVRAYDEVIRDEHAREVLHTLRMSRTFVLVGHGAGLQDPNWGSFLRWTEGVFQGSEYRHFRLVLADELDRARAEHPSGQRIFPISYGAKHSDLGPFLASLVPAARSIPAVTGVATPHLTPPAPPPKTVILRINIGEGHHHWVTEATARTLVDDADPACLEYEQSFDRQSFTPRQWRAIARGLDQLVMKAEAAAEGPTRYVIAARAPLPVLAYLGARMVRLGPILVANFFEGKWELFGAPESCPPGGRDDFTVEPPGLGRDRTGRLALSLQCSKHYVRDDTSLATMVAVEPVDFLGTYMIRKSAHSHLEAPLSAADLPVLMRHVDRGLEWMNAQAPNTDGLVVAVGGPNWVAFWLGRRLNPTVCGRVDFPNFVKGKGYLPALSCPMAKAPWLAGQARLLVMNAEPSDQVAVEGGRNFAGIQTAIESKLGRNGPFEIRLVGAAKIRQLVDEIEEFKPDILHLHLHGSAQGELAFENEHDVTDRITTEALVARVRTSAHQPTLIVVSACYSSTVAPSLLGFAECVIGMSGKTRTKLARQFAEFFYTSLARGNSLARAIEQGKVEAGHSSVQTWIEGDLRPEDVIIFPRRR
jgi:hypothetical protein